MPSAALFIDKGQTTVGVLVGADGDWAPAL
jgi:hypothetical protein